MFLGIKCYIIQAMNVDMNKPLCKFIQNMDRNKTGKFGACTLFCSGDVPKYEEKTNF